MRVLLFANTDWYLYNFRLSLALAIRKAGHEVVLTSPPGLYGQRLRELGLEWIPAPMERRSLNPFREASLVLWLRRLIAIHRIDLVHGFTIKCAVYGALAARSSGKVARVAAIAGMGYVFTSNGSKARVLRPFVRALMRLAFDGPRCRLILQNRDDASLLEAAGLVASDIVRMIPGSGVDCDRFSISENRSGEPRGQRLRVLFPARLLWDKGISEFVSAARSLLAEGRSIEFLIAGTPDPGNPAAVPVSTVEGWADEGSVQWLGHVDDMPTLFQSVDVAVLPSYREGLPKGLIEAAACGLPIITTDAPGCREVVTDGVNGLLVPVKNSAALAAAIARLHEDPALRARLGTAARERVLTHFDERIILDRTMSVYLELVPSAGGV
jgi:glycosyltransferase involved in cell wall biosynthesis